MVDGEDNVAGLLNIAKCLYDAIHRLEKKAHKAEEDKKAGGGGLDLAASVLQVRPDAAVLQARLGLGVNKC